MGTTTSGLPYPEPSDKISAGDDAIKALAEAVDAKLAAKPVPVADGGTGSTTQRGAIENLRGVESIDGLIKIRWDSAALNYVPSINGTDTSPLCRIDQATTIANNAASSAGSGKLPTSGGTISGNLQINGHLFVPNAFAASSGYTIAYINGDGRLSRNASSRRYKENISEIDPPELDDVFAAPLVEFEWIGGDGSRIIGYIAEQLAEHPATERFVQRDDDGRPESIDPIQLLLAQVRALEARVKDLESRGSG